MPLAKSPLNRRGFCTVALSHPLFNVNVGSVLRLAGCYGIDMLVLGGPDRTVDHRRSSADTQKAWRHIPTLRAIDVLDCLPIGAEPIAVEVLPDATPLPRFVHPERAYYIFGPEDGGLSREVIESCRYRIVIPTLFCLNLGMAVATVLYDRKAKQKL